MKQEKLVSEKDQEVEYRRPDNKPSCDKGSHKERSIANQPNHRKHWDKVRRSEAK